MRLLILLLMSSLLAACAGSGQGRAHGFEYDQDSAPVQARDARQARESIQRREDGPWKGARASHRAAEEVLASPSTEEGAVRRMADAIAAAERLQDSEELPDEEREVLTQALVEAHAALARYRGARAKKAARVSTLGAIGVAAAAIVADDATVVGVADDPLLIPLALAAMVAAIQAHAPALRDELANSWLDLGRQLEVLRRAVAMTSRGNVVHEHLVEEARNRVIERAAAAGAKLTESQVTREMLCDELERMMREFRRAKNTEKWKKTISTLKGLECRPSRNSRE